VDKGSDGEDLMRTNSWLGSLLFLAAITVFHAGAAAQGYPSKPIRIVVAFAPGGGNDILSRVLAQKLTEAWGQQVLVENRPGASGILGTSAVANAEPDGHTLLMGFDGTLVINPLIFSKLPYDTFRDFAPITKVTDAPLIIVAHPNTPANSVGELISLAKARPGELNFASPGTGTTPHMAGELFKSLTNINIVHVSYKGGGQAVVDVLSGQVPLFFVAIPTVQAYVKQGRLKAIAVTTARRSSTLPDVPTVAESGVPGFNVAAWFGLAAPKSTPRPVVVRLQTEVARILTLADVKERLATLGLEPVGNTPEEFTAQIKADMETWSKVVATAGIKAD
jgi:tripartite-type tricarboxylate transporter receptor subunit TctC